MGLLNSIPNDICFDISESLTAAACLLSKVTTLPRAPSCRSFRGGQSVRVGVVRRAKPGATCLFVLKPAHTAVCSSLPPVALGAGDPSHLVLRRVLMAVCPDCTFPSAASASGTARPRYCRRSGFDACSVFLLRPPAFRVVLG